MFGSITPGRPLEACGTSGMKAAMNGVLNLSILDGWWPEACVHGVNGWQFGDGVEGSEAHDLESLYKVPFGGVLPSYYDRRDKWVQMMRSSISMSQKRFSWHPMIQSTTRRCIDESRLSGQSWASRLAGAARAWGTIMRSSAGLLVSHCRPQDAVILRAFLGGIRSAVEQFPY